LQIRVHDLVLFGPWIRDPDPGWKKNSELGSGMNIPDLIFENLVSVFWDPRIFQPWIRDGEKSDREYGMGKNRIRNIA
jgi:hypothetical protein